MKKMCILPAVFVLCVTAYAQRADFVTRLIAADKATYGEVCYLSAVYQGFVGENASYEDALHALVQKGQANSRADVNGAVTLQELSWLMAKLWDIKGGLMYRATKRSARYTFRQFKVDGILPATADPSKKASGSDVLNMYTACLRTYGGAE
ncbi:hypothetical protein [Treponema sp. SP13]|uniref:hypothetical protein n=1 Tax=Treponema sp. SP13 TaxID=2789742 RepID=UPI003D941F90